MKLARRSSVLAAMLACSLVARAQPSLAAPKKNARCIAAAESGQQLRSSGKLLEARKAFGACTQSTCPAVVRRDCGRWIDEIDSATPSVTVKLEDERGADVAEGRVLVDGEPLLRAEGRATPIDPGVHKFVWLRGAGDVDQELVVREGEHNRVIVIKAPKPPMIAPPPPPPDAADNGKARSPLPFVIGGLGLALAGTGGVMWGIGLGERSNLQSTCSAAHACTQNDVDASKTKLLVGDVLIGVGLVAIAGAVILFVSQGGPPGTSTSASR